MKNIFLIIVAFSLLSFTNGRIKHEYKNREIKCYYETNQGRLDGSYVSYYKNGEKKSEGEFENNYRTGKWTLWDSTGKMVLQRQYDSLNPFAFKRIFPKVSGDTSKLLNKPPYQLVYNKDNYIEDFPLYVKDLLWQKRLLRYIVPKDNPILFENNMLFNVLNNNVIQNNLEIYVDENFFSKYLYRTLDTSSTIKVIGYKIQESRSFDRVRQASESRIYAICPVVYDTIKHKTFNLYWIYFPDDRKYLAQQNIEKNIFPNKIKTLDDLFFYRCFNGEIYQQSNFGKDVIYKEFKSSKRTDKKAEKIEISLIERENNTLMLFAQNKNDSMSNAQSDSSYVYKKPKFEKDSLGNFVYFKGNGGQIKFRLNAKSTPYSKKYIDSTSDFYLVNSYKPSKKIKLTNGIYYHKNTATLKSNLNEDTYGSIVNINETGFLVNLNYYNYNILFKNKRFLTLSNYDLNNDSLRYFKFSNAKSIDYSTDRRANLNDFTGGVIGCSIFAIVIAPLISINYKNGGFNKNRFYDVSGAGLIALTVSIPLNIITNHDYFKLTTKNGKKARNLWYLDSEPKK